MQNPKYKANNKNGGVIPPVNDLRVQLVPRRCGNCIECRKQKAREWQVRMLEDVKHHKNGKFITFTFSNESIAKIVEEIRKYDQTIEGYDLDNEIAVYAMRHFLEKWRKKYKKSVRHWFITELGHKGTENIHLHGIIWTDRTFDEIKERWSYGFMWPRPEEYRANFVSEKTVNYIIKYITKKDEKHKTYKSIILCSSGIGKAYIDSHNAKTNKYCKGETDETYKTRSGHNVALPLYYRNKLYSDEEKEKLWIEKLDKNERYVLGKKVDVSKGYDEYYKLLEQAKKYNKKMGYGDDGGNWSREQYENERRNLLIKKRIENNNNKKK